MRIVVILLVFFVQFICTEQLSFSAEDKTPQLSPVKGAAAELSQSLGRQFQSVESDTGETILLVVPVAPSPAVVRPPRKERSRAGVDRICVTPTAGLVLPGGDVRLCPGTYQLSDGMVIDRPAVVRGYGQVTLIGPGGSYPYKNGIYIETSDVTVSGITFENWFCGIYGNPEYVSGPYGERITISENVFRDNYDGMIGWDWTHSVVKNNQAINNQSGITLARYYRPESTVGQNVVHNNSVLMTSFPSSPVPTTGISVENNNVSPDPATHLKDIGVINNTVVYTGCREYKPECGSFGIEVNQIVRATVTGNMIYGMGTAGIFADMTNSVLSHNTIQDLWSRGYLASGLFDVEFLGWWGGGPRNNLYQDNVVALGAGPNRATIGFYGFHVFVAGWDGNVIENNAFKGLVYGYKGHLVDPTGQANQLYRNNLLDNHVQIEDLENTQYQGQLLVAKENHYSDFSKQDCNPDDQGYCQNPRTDPANWPDNSDPRAKFEPY